MGVSRAVSSQTGVEPPGGLAGSMAVGVKVPLLTQDEEEGSRMRGREGGARPGCRKHAGEKGGEGGGTQPRPCPAHELGFTGSV